VPVPVAIVTGFLGSGKTTLIGRLLRDPAYAGTAVIVNEFGEIALDHELMAVGDETLLALSTGCLCCAVRTDLVATLLDLDRRRAAGEIAFGRVLIETSGLADPAPILHALMLDAALAGRFALGGVLTLVDSLLGAATLAAHPEARRQVAFADHVLLTKTDLAAPDATLLDALGRLGRAAASTTMPPAAALFAPPAILPDPPALPAHTQGIAACVIRRAVPVPALALTLLMQALAEQCGVKLLRLKGIAALAEAPDRPAVLHAVQHVVAPVDFLPAWPAGPRATRIVAIGSGIPPHFPARLLDAIISEMEDPG
jgi:G3E family GTPase